MHIRLQSMQVAVDSQIDMLQLYTVAYKVCKLLMSHRLARDNFAQSGTKYVGHCWLTDRHVTTMHSRLYSRQLQLKQIMPQNRALSSLRARPRHN